MRTFILLFIPFISFSQVRLIDEVYIKIPNSSNSCACTLDNVITNSNLAYHPFVITDGINETAFRASEGIIGESVTGNYIFSFGLYGGIPSAVLSDPISGNIISITTGNITSPHGFQTPDHGGILETNDFQKQSIFISGSIITIYHGLTYTPNYCIITPMDSFSGLNFVGWYLISSTSTSITLGLQNPTTGVLNFLIKYQ